MKNKKYIFILWLVLISCITISCERDSDSPKGMYIYQNGEFVVATEKDVLQEIEASMVLVEGGTFDMGATSEQSGLRLIGDEEPVHKVTLNTFYISSSEVTQLQWEVVMGWNPSHFKGANLPVENVSWYNCNEFIDKLNALTEKHYRLPTEAEWEYAARGGNKSKGYIYAGSNKLSLVAWNQRSPKTHPIKNKRPNELGLYDMSGNVMEWCSDWYGRYSSNSQINPKGSSSGFMRVLRGGSWCSDERSCSVFFRHKEDPSYRGDDDNGFRLVLEQ